MKINKISAFGLIMCLLFLGTMVLWQLSVSAAAGKPDSPITVTAKPEEDKLVETKSQLETEIEEKQKLQQEEGEIQAEKAVDSHLSKLQDQVKAYLDKQAGTFGFVLLTKVNVGSDTVEKAIGYNQNESFKMASTYKVPVILYLYQQVAQKKISLEDKLVYEGEFYTEGTCSLQYESPGKAYSIRELASRAIRESDNVALNILFNRLGSDNITNFMKSLGGAAVYNETPWATPNELALYMQSAADFAVQNPELGNLLIDDLKNTIFNDRIRAGTPSNIAVAHKIGNLGGVVNDVAIVYAPKGPYILAIMSKEVPDDVAAAKTEAELAKMVYEALN